VKITRLALAGALLAGLTLGQSGAHSAALVAFPGNQEAPYHPTAVVAGNDLNYIQLDPLVSHNVVAEDTDNKPRPWCGSGKPYPANACPIFYSGAPVGAGTVATVQGVSSLAPGTYEFYCAPHKGRGQIGTLTVV
jgi:plastocyanin